MSQLTDALLNVVARHLIHINVASVPTPVSTANPLPVTSVAGGSVVATPTSGALTDRSGSVTTGGTAQNAAAALTTRKYLYIENPYTATETLWFSTTATAVADSPSIALQPGDTWENPPHFCPAGAVSVIAATTGHKWTAREG